MAFMGWTWILNLGMINKWAGLDLSGRKTHPARTSFTDSFV